MIGSKDTERASGSGLTLRCGRLALVGLTLHIGKRCGDGRGFRRGIGHGWLAGTMTTTTRRWRIGPHIGAYQGTLLLGGKRPRIAVGIGTGIRCGMRIPGDITTIAVRFIAPGLVGWMLGGSGTTRAIGPGLIRVTGLGRLSLFGSRAGIGKRTRCGCQAVTGRSRCKRQSL
jgi:hypothetical protein